MKLIWIGIVSTALAAQTTPPQFGNLHTDSTDYTCDGLVPCATWPMPPIPAPGGSYADANFGTTTYRLVVPPANTSGQAFSIYNRVQAWNSDGTKMLVSELQGYADLYDATQTPPKPINRITADVGFILPVSTDVLWSFTDPNKIYYVPNVSSGHGLELRSIDVSACTAANCTLKSTLIHTFSCTSGAIGSNIPSGTAGNMIETGSGAQGGMFDKTDRYFSFTCDKVDSNSRHEIDFIRYDRQMDAVTTQIPWYTVCPSHLPQNCAVWGKQQAGMIRMNQHPDSRYITVIWQCGSTDKTWTRGCGVEVFDPSYNFLGVAYPYPGHQDTGYDVNGVPVLVNVGSVRSDALDERSVAIADLTKVSPTGQTYKRIVFPCSFSRQPTCTGTFLGSKPGHISMTGTWGNVPGYALYSTMSVAGPAIGYAPRYPLPTTLGTAVSGPGTFAVTPASMAQIGVGVVSTVDIGTAMESVTWTAVTATTATAVFSRAHAATAQVFSMSVGETGFGAMENFAVKIDTTAPDSSSAITWRVARAMSIRDNDYDAEPHTAVNRDFSQIVWGSTWNVDPGNNGPVYGFWLKLTGTPIPPNPCPCTQEINRWGWKIICILLIVGGIAFWVLWRKASKK